MALLKLVSPATIFLLQDLGNLLANLSSLKFIVLTHS